MPASDGPVEGEARVDDEGSSSQHLLVDPVPERELGRSHRAAARRLKDAADLGLATVRDLVAARGPQLRAGRVSGEIGDWQADGK